jgi:Tfp pilus assembly protein PilO
VKPGRRSAKQPATARRSGGKAVIALAVMGGLVLLYGWNSFFLGPKSEAKAGAHKELVAARQQEQQLRGNLTELRKLASDSQAREAELSRLGRLIPADPDVPGAIDTLNETARAAEVAWSSFVPAPPAPAAGGPSATSIGMQVSGTFQQVFDYLRRLELLDRLVVIDSLELMAGAAEGAGPSRLDADIKARIFSTGTAAPAQATAAAGAKASPSDTAALPKAGEPHQPPPSQAGG